jgi:hypothetical protein
MKLRHILFLSLFVIAAFNLGGSVSVAAPATGDAPGKAFPPKFLDGNRLNLYEKPYRYPADEPSHVFQGWFLPNWSDLTSDEKLYFNYLTVELTIDGEPVKLKTWQHHYAEFEFDGVTYYDVKVKGFYVEFPAYHFEKGKYVFELRPTNQPTQTVTIKFY